MVPDKKSVTFLHHTALVISDGLSQLYEIIFHSEYLCITSVFLDM